MYVSWLPENIRDFDWQQFGITVFHSIIYIILVLAVARFTYAVIVYLLKRMMKNRSNKAKSVTDERKINTMFSLIQSVVFYLFTFTVFLHILQRVFDFDTGTLLASAGVLGVAVGFGAQSLVKDIIGGFFIVFEDQYQVGEMISVGEFTGTIEEIGIRATRIRAWSGELHIIPNGNISAVTNFNRGKMLAKVEIPISYEEDLERVMKKMNQVCEGASEEFADKIVEPPLVQGVIQFGERNVVLRVIAFAQPGEQFPLERELRRKIHKALLEEGIKMPQPQQVILGDPDDSSRLKPSGG